MHSPHKATLARREFIGRAAAAGAAAAGLASCAAPSRLTSRRDQPRPNILLIVTDDQRADALGCMGNPIIQTPHVDRLASQGTLFAHHFCTTSICMTSRASILTGLYARRHGIHRFQDPLPPARFEQTYPVLLRGAGYHTGFVGKWGLGGPMPAEAFDYFRGFGGQGRYVRQVDGQTVHLTGTLADQAVEFLRTRPDDRPFCLSISTKAPHCQDGDPKQFLYDPRLESLYRDVTIPTPKTASPRSFEALPQFLQRSEGRVRWRLRFSTPEQFQTMVRAYYRLVSGVDAAVGRVMTQLDELGLADNTVVIYTSDNGFFLGEHGLAGKWLMYEESIRVPLVVCDPRLPRRARGRSCEQMTLLVDLAPTILDLAGVEIPPAVQGRSLRPLLEGDAPRWRQDWFYEHLFAHPRIPRCEGVRTARWKYIRYLDPLLEELYDLHRDPTEERSLAADADHREVLRDPCRRRWEQFRTQLV